MALLQRLAQARLQRQTLAGGLGHVFAEKAPGVGATAFGTVDGSVRALHQVFGAQGMVGVQANAHTYADHHRQPIWRGPGPGGGGHQSLRHFNRVFFAFQVFNHHA